MVVIHNAKSLILVCIISINLNMDPSQLCKNREVDKLWSVW